MVPDTSLLAAEVSALLGDSTTPTSGERVGKICGILEIDRPAVEDDAAFLVLVAVALSPELAIRYKLSDPPPRWSYIREYLNQFTELGAGELEVLARRVARILDDRGKRRSRIAYG